MPIIYFLYIALSSKIAIVTLTALSLYPLLEPYLGSLLGLESSRIDWNRVGATVFLCYLLTAIIAYLIQRYRVFTVIKQKMESYANRTSKRGAMVGFVFICTFVISELSVILYAAFMNLWAGLLLAISATLILVQARCSSSIPYTISRHMRVIAYIGLFWAVVLVMLVEYVKQTTPVSYTHLTLPTIYSV